MINLLDNFNMHNIIAIRKFQPENIIFIYEDTKENNEVYNELREFIIEKSKGINIKGVSFKKFNILEVENWIINNTDKETIINISGGNKFKSLILYQIAQKHNLKTIFVDLESEKMYEFDKNDIKEVIKEEFILEIDSYIGSRGGEIITESTSIYSDENIEEILAFFMENYAMWYSVKKILKNQEHVKKTNYMMPQEIIIRTNGIDYKQKNDVMKLVYKLKELKHINMKWINEHELFIKFKESYIKNFIFTTGSWLEAITYKVIKEIRDISDVKAGVMFLWDRNVHVVRNELDVLASFDGSLLCISCKDTNRYDEATLNELQVYSERLAGNNVKKLLISTQLPLKHTIIERADEMNIKIIIFDGNIEKFKNELYLTIQKLRNENLDLA
jgi:hypothetical protein